MHYIRLLKSPSFKERAGPAHALAKSKKNAKLQDEIPRLEVLLTVTTDLGELFYPYDVRLHVVFHVKARGSVSTAQKETGHQSKRRRHVLDRTSHGEQVLEREAQWTAGMRDLRVSLPLPDKPDTEHFNAYTLTITAASEQRPAVHDDGTMVIASILGIRVEQQTSSDGETHARYLRVIPLVYPAFTDPPSGLDKTHISNRESSANLRVHEASPHSSIPIASHVWDAGVATATFLPHLLSGYKHRPDTSLQSSLPKLAGTVQTALNQQQEQALPFNVIELGCGCAPLSSSLVSTLKVFAAGTAESTAAIGGDSKFEITLTDLAEAEEPANNNMSLFGLSSADPSYASDTGAPKPLKFGGTAVSTRFQPLDWESTAASTDPDHGLPESFRHKRFDLIMASDVTYNPDTSPALVKTLAALYDHSIDASPSTTHPAPSPNAGEDGIGSTKTPLILIARKFRHKDENVFWTEMDKAGFGVIEKARIWCPAFEGAEVGGEEGECVECFVFQRGER